MKPILGLFGISSVNIDNEHALVDIFYSHYWLVKCHNIWILQDHFPSYWEINWGRVKKVKIRKYLNNLSWWLFCLLWHLFWYNIWNSHYIGKVTFCFFLSPSNLTYFHIPVPCCIFQYKDGITSCVKSPRFYQYHSLGTIKIKKVIIVK